MTLEERVWATVDRYGRLRLGSRTDGSSFGISTAQVSRIARRAHWAHIEE